MRKICLKRGGFCLVDDIDYEALNKFVWDINSNVYVVRYVPKFELGNPKPTCERIHREILGLKRHDGIVVDHINGIKTDNRRCNLRICNESQNAMNRGMERGNKSGYKGVSWDKVNKKWLVVIGYGGGKQKHIGRFLTKEQAYEAYCNAAKELHGEFVNLG